MFLKIFSDIPVDFLRASLIGIILMDVRAKLQWNAETAPNNIPQCLQ